MHVRFKSMNWGKKWNTLIDTQSYSVCSNFHNIEIMEATQCKDIFYLSANIAGRATVSVSSLFHLSSLDVPTRTQVPVTVPCQFLFSLLTGPVHIILYSIINLFPFFTEYSLFSFFFVYLYHSVLAASIQIVQHLRQTYFTLC